MLISFLFLHENICCGCSLEAPHQGTSNEYPQHMFLWRNKKNIMWIPPLICSYAFWLNLTLKMPRKPASENVLCLCCLLNILVTFQTYFCIQANSVDPDQTAPRKSVWSGSTLFAKMTFNNHKMAKQMTIVAIGRLRYRTRAGVCETLCPQLPDSNIVWLQHCLPMMVTTVQIYKISMLFYSKGNNCKMGDNSDKKKKYVSPIWVTYFFTRNPYMEFQTSMHSSNLCYASKSVQCKNAQNDKGP